MKKILRKTILLSLILMAATVVCVMTNSVSAKAADLKKQLVLPEDGWTRYDDTDSKIVYDNKWKLQGQKNVKLYNETRHSSRNNVGAVLKFKFYGTKVRIISWMAYNNSGANVKIDNEDCGNHSSYLSDKKYGGSYLFFEKQGLKEEEHEVVITTVDKNALDPKVGGNYCFGLDAIDIDSTGKLLDYDEKVTGISLNKTVDVIKVGNTDVLTATVVPDDAANKNVLWKSSNTAVATVDDNGKVTAVGEGTAKITVETTDGSNLTAECEVTVTKAEKRKILTIYSNSRKECELNLSEEEVNDFINWYDARSKGIAPAYYVFKNVPLEGGKTGDLSIAYDHIANYQVVDA